MIVLNNLEFISKKTSDSIVILGSGYSIHKVSWESVSKVNSIGFNWFCKHFFAPTFFLIREQANNKQRTSHDENPNILLNLLNRENYIQRTNLIIANVKRGLNYTDRIGEFLGRGIILKDVTGIYKMRYIVKDIFKFGIVHGKCTLMSVLHICNYLGYKNIYFAGIDLYNSRYFWLPKNKTRHTVLKRGHNYDSVHRIAKTTLDIISNFKKRKPNIFLYSLNKKSLLNKIITYSENIE